MLRLSAAVLVSVGISATLASAQEPIGPTCTALTQKDCACVIPLPPKGKPAANLSEMRGEVLISGLPGLSASSTGTAMLMIGDSVVVPDKGSARLTAANCDKTLPQMSSLVIREMDGCGCASLVTTDPITVGVVQTTTTGSTSGGAAVAVLGGAVGAAGIVYLLTQQGGDDSVSP